MYVRRETPEQRDEAAEILLNALKSVSGIRARLDTYAEPADGSALAGDNRRSPRFPPSVEMHYSISGAVSCLEELHDLLLDESESRISITSRPYGQIALIRQALDMAVHGAYLLSPRGRTERIRRVFLFQKENERLARKALTSFGVSPATGHEDYVEDFHAAAEEIDLDVQSLKGNFPSTTSILEQIEAEEWTQPRNYLGTWQIASGFAHGMPWAMQKTGELEEVAPSSNTASSTYRVTIGFTLLCSLAGNAVLLITDVVNLYIQRARRQY